MDARMFVLALVSISLIVLASCSSPENQVDTKSRTNVTSKSGLSSVTNSNEDKNVELLVGKWQAIKIDKQILGPNNNLFAEFTKDKIFIFLTNGSSVPSQKRTGVYELKGDIITFVDESKKNKKNDRWDVTIDKLSDDELVLTGGPPNERSSTFFVRKKTE